jgi:hypothetical protein
MNTMNTNMTTTIPTIRPPTFPARPINGGPLNENTPTKHGTWQYEPKYNGWRTLVHVPSGTMFNRHGARLSIAGEFKVALEKLKRTKLAWLDCEALERRHNIGRGSLIILDTPEKQSYRERRSLLEFATLFADIPFYKDLHQPLPNDTAALTMSYSPGGELQLWDILQQCNRSLGVPFYEGLVFKELNSTYPIQLRSDKEEFHFWVKHRWAF